MAGTAARLEKISHLADLLTRVPPDAIAIVIGFLSGEPRQGRMKIGGALLSGMRDVAPADAASLDVFEIDTAFDRIAALSGPGSAATRAQLLRDLFVRATRDEQDFLMRLLFGELRQGALEGILMDAVARASGIPAGRIRRAAMLAGIWPGGAGGARHGGPAVPFSCNRSSRCSRCLPTRRRMSARRPSSAKPRSTLLDGAHPVHKDGMRVIIRTLRDVTIAGSGAARAPCPPHSC